MLPDEFLWSIERQKQVLSASNCLARYEMATDEVEQRAVAWVIINEGLLVGSKLSRFINLLVNEDDGFLRLTALTLGASVVDFDDVALNERNLDEDFIYWLRAAAKQELVDVLQICTNLIEMPEFRAFLPSVVAELRSNSAIVWVKEFLAESACESEKIIALIALAKLGDRSEITQLEAAIEVHSIPHSVRLAAIGGLVVSDSDLGFRLANEIIQRGNDGELSLLAVAIRSSLGSAHVPKNLRFRRWIEQFLSG